MTRRASGIVACCLWAALAGNCGRPPNTQPVGRGSERTAPPAAPQALVAVALPDLSGAATSVATQLRSQHALLMRQMEDPAAQAGDLASAYGQLGTLLLAAEYRDSAVPCLLDAQALAPGERRWPYYLAHLHRLKGETAKSAAFFERALQLKPDDEATMVWLGAAYLDLGQADAAEPLFTKARALQPQSAAAVFGLGRTALARRELGRAAEYLETTLTLDPKASIVHYRLALAYRGMGRMADAEAEIRRKGDRDVLLADPLLDQLSAALRSEFASEHLGVEALNRRDFPAAIAHFRRGVELAPDDASLRHRLGTALALSGDGPGAAAEFYEVLRRTPNFASTHYALGVLIAANGRYADAIAHFSAAVKGNPGYVEARLQLADTLRRSGRPQEALPHYEQVARIDPRVVEAPIGVAMALGALGRYGEARDRLSDSVARYPGRPAVVHALIRVLSAAPDDRVRDGARAVALAQDLLMREPPNPDLGEVTAMAMAEAGRYDEAVMWEQRAVAIAERAGRTDVSTRMTENLRLFERHQPCRRPWHGDEAAGADTVAPF